MQKYKGVKTAENHTPVDDSFLNVYFCVRIKNDGTMDTNRIQQKIVEIARQLAAEGATYTRAELAYELKELGVSQDTYQVGELVWQTWCAFKNVRTQIEQAFTDNARQQSLVDTLRLGASLDAQHTGQAVSLVQKEARQTGDALEGLGSLIDVATYPAFSGVSGSSLTGVLTGTAGVEKVRQEADQVFQLYSNLVQGYESSRQDIQSLTDSFVEIRGDIEGIFRKYTLALVDVFGDSIRVVMPELFDFSRIEWLDTQQLLAQTSLQYTTVTSRCAELMSEITDSFKSSLQLASTSYKTAGNRKVGLILAGLNMVGHYLDASARTSELKAGLVTLKNDMRRDVTSIRADMLRLTKIYKQVNEVFLPQAETFYRYADRVLDKETKGLLDAVYAHGEAAALKAEREDLLKEYRQTERGIHDAQAHIAYYDAHIKECSALLESMESQYRQAMNSKPSRPFFLLNWLTLGSMGRTYNRRITEWSETCAPLVKRYEDLQVDVKLDKEDQATQEGLLKEYLSQYAALKEKLDAGSKRIRESIQADPTTKQAVAAHLRDLTALLLTAKTILENRLEERDLHTVPIDAYGEIALPEEVSQQIDQLTAGLQAYAAGTCPPEMTGKETADAALAKASEAFNAWVKLRMLAQADAQSAAHYRQQLDTLRDRFQQEMSHIDQQSAALREIIARCHTTQDDRILKEGLISLSGKQYPEWTDHDWNEFFKGNKEITI